MIDATASIRAAERISAATLSDYLRATGWSSRPSRVEGIAIFSKRVSGADNPVQFILPVEPAFDEEQRRVADALRTIAQIERCPEAWVAEKVVQLADGEMAASEHALRNDPLAASEPEPTRSRRREIPPHIGSAARARFNLENEVEE